MKNKAEDIHQQLLKLTLSGRPLGESSSNGFARCGLRVPEVRALLKTPLVKQISKLPRNQALDIWHYVYLNTPCYELGGLCIYFYQYRELSRAEFNKLKQWTNRCDCWEHSDDLSKVYADTLEGNPSWVIPVLEKWNQSKKPWQRRQSIVSLLEYAQKRHTVLPFSKLISFVEPLLDDPEYYVQKGVGWTLREIYNVYPKEMKQFFNTHYSTIQPTSWSAAVEKLEPNLQKTVNLKRKTARSNNS